MRLIYQLAAVLFEAEELFADVRVPCCPWCLISKFETPKHMPDCALVKWLTKVKAL